MTRLALFLLFVCALPAQAGPLKKVAHAIANHVTLDLAAAASSGFATGGTFYCRSHNPDVERCTERYGSAAGGEIARGILTGSLIALSEWGRREKFKEWFVPDVGAAVGNTYWGIREIRTHEKPDAWIARSAFVHR